MDAGVSVHGAAKSQKQSTDVCDVGLRTDRFKSMIWQHRKITGPSRCEKPLLTSLHVLILL